MTESNKIELFEKGYTKFNLYELGDSEINESLDDLYSLGNEEFKTLRYKKVKDNSSTFIKDSFLDLESIKESIIKNNLFEIWYCNEVVPKDKFNKKLLNKIKQFFYNENLDTFNHTSYITMYNDNCFLTEHKDGFNPNSKYKCVILIYLNKEEEIKIGGNLILDDMIEIKPILGEVVIIDFTKNDVKHGVSIVYGYERKCFLNFC
jgi:Rps23 Pro-64 3,4-dihydroxylase Tpa1-like proline 4-hydroxylase